MSKFFKETATSKWSLLALIKDRAMKNDKYTMDQILGQARRALEGYSNNSNDDDEKKKADYILENWKSQRMEAINWLKNQENTTTQDQTENTHESSESALMLFKDNSRLSMKDTTFNVGKYFNNNQTTSNTSRKTNIEEEEEENSDDTDGYKGDIRSYSSDEHDYSGKSDYEYRESTPSSDSTAQETPKKTKKDYLVSTNEDDLIENKWLLQGGFDFSEKFISRRNTLVENCRQCDRILEQDEELAINGIILLDDDIMSNIIDEDHYQQACDEMKGRYSIYEDDNDSQYFNQITRFSQLMTKGRFEDALSFVSSSSLPPHIKAILLSLQRTYCKGYSTEELNENSIIKDGVLPFFDNYFPNSRKYTTFGAEKGIIESKQRFLDIDPSLVEHVRKADFSVVSNFSKHLVLALESKSVRNKGKSGTDLIKLARYMKDTIDSIGKDGFKQVKIAGIITSGACASVYIMEHKYNYLYTLYKQDQFYIPLNHHDMFRIVPIFTILNQVKNILNETVLELCTLKHERSNPVLLKSVKTYHTPTQIPDSRKKRVNLNSPAAKNAKRRLVFKK